MCFPSSCYEFELKKFSVFDVHDIGKLQGAVMISQLLLRLLLLFIFITLEKRDKHVPFNNFSQLILTNAVEEVRSFEEKLITK